MEEVQYDFSRICRTCKIAGQEMKSVYEGCEIFDENLRIDEMLMACTSLQVRVGDGLPVLMCVPCTEQLKSAYCFKKQCLQTDLCLKKYSQVMKEHYEVKVEESQLQQTVPETDELKLNPPPATTSDYIEFLDQNQILLTCRDCGKFFTSIDELKIHKQSHLEIRYKCRHCGKGFTRQSLVYRHELSHGKHKLHVCRVCNKTLTRMEHLKRHLATHLKEKPFACTTCNRGFIRSDHVEVHQAKCKGDRVHICDICNRAFSRQDSLDVHKGLHENQTPVLPTMDNIDNTELHYYEIDYDPNLVDDYSAGSEAEDFLEPRVEVNETCVESEIKKDEHESTVRDNNTEDIISDAEDDDMAPDGVAENDSDSTHSEYLPTKTGTGKRRRGRARSKKHGAKRRGRPSLTEETTELKYPCSMCEHIFTKISHLDKHMKIHFYEVKDHTCASCNETFSRYNHYKRHLLSTHLSEKLYSCEICAKEYFREEQLFQHMKVHDKKQEFECDVCNRKFSRADLLAKHKFAKHNEGGDQEYPGRKFECHICMKVFTTEKYRDIHVKGHLGEKRFQCKICTKCFLSKSHLTEHMKFHNDNSKKFLCSECGQRFIRNDYLVIHMRRHRGEKPFKCKFCGKGFPRTTDLTVHERYHTGEKTHLCTICGRGFGRAYNLTVHMRTHTGEKPYRCTYCDAAFAQGNDLKAHVRRHTGERFQCDLCTENFLMGYLLTQHKRTVHGLNVISNIRRLQPLNKIKQDDDEPPPITIPLPKPVIPDMVLSNLSAQLAAQLQQHQLVRE